MTSEDSDAYQDWYVESVGDIEQGDLFDGVRVVRPGLKDGKYTFTARDARVVVLTQSCDVRKVDLLLVAEVHDYDVLVATTDDGNLKSSEYRKALARGQAVTDFLMPPLPSIEMNWSVVNFFDIYQVPKALLEDDGATRIGRLGNPYVEYLSQGYARFMMRVGLPTVLTEFENRKPVKPKDNA